MRAFEHRKASTRHDPVLLKEPARKPTVEERTSSKS
jgi:hypothetical protein